MDMQVVPKIGISSVVHSKHIEIRVVLMWSAMI